MAECSKGSLSHSAILLTSIKLPFAFKIFVLPNLEWPFYTGFTVCEIKATSFHQMRLT